MPHFLFELGLEEVPARMIAGAQAELLKRTLALLTREQLIAADAIAKSYSTPRRLAVLIHDVKAQQDDITEEVTGPAVKIAFKDGVPTPAAEAFARKSGVAVADLRTVQTPKGEYLAATSVKKGLSASEVIARELPKELAAIYWAKSMYWRAGKPERFVRPVLWMLCLLGDNVVPVAFAGKTTGRASYGHRVLSSGEAFEVQTPASYLVQLEGEYVLADVEARRHKIRKALDHVTRRAPGTRWREDEALVDGVTHLTEWPDVLLGSFEPEYLALPEEVLVTVMRDHQKYFAVEDAGGKLAPHFLAVLNIGLNEVNGPIIRQGNERVLRARFNDARFFWEFDQRTPLADRTKLLENVTFQKDLGSYALKTKRVQALAAKFAALVIERGKQIDADAIAQAAALAKTDLTTELVKEFTELQGVIGGLYARAQGVSEAAAAAIYDQYLPSSAKDPVPRSPEGAVLGLADRADTLGGMFGLGMEPTGSKDPFALRRAANAIVRILTESGLPLTLADVVATAPPDVQSRLRAFFSERIDFYLRESRGQAYDVIKAVMAVGADDLADLSARSEAVSAARGSEDFLAVSAAFKRMKNILAQAKEKGDVLAPADSMAAQASGAEAALAAQASATGDTVKALCAGRDYAAALESIATLRPPIDAFFDQVMVMDPDADIRQRRLGLLASILTSFAGIADFSEIVVTG
jgi:glycyl-tRNA synthetase beta chain